MPIIQTTINDLRTTIVANAGDTYYTKDLGQEGNWYYDPTDTTSVDNTGITLIGLSNVRYKRIFDGFVNAKWFGVKGDAWEWNPSPTDDTAAIQLALDTMQIWLNPSYSVSMNQTISESKGSLFFSAGYYLTSTITIISSGIVFEQAKVNIVGAGIKSTIFVGKSQYYEAPPGSTPSAGLPINIIPILQNENYYTTMRDFAIIGNYLEDGVYGLVNGELGGPYYQIGPGYEHIGIFSYDTADCNYEGLYIRSCSIGINAIGSLLSNISKCIIGGDQDFLNGEYNPRTACDYGIYFDKSAGYDANQISIRESRIIWCKKWGLVYQNGTMLNINECDFTSNGSAIEGFSSIGNPDSGAIKLFGFTESESATQIVNIRGTWFETNSGFNILKNSDDSTIINLFNNFLSGVDGSTLFLGTKIDTNPTNSIEIKTINIIGCMSSESLFSINVEEANIIGSFFTNLNIVNPPSQINNTHFKL